jgi:(4-(4-[2-(gamma-L-glutamylamino)ethyl]phenoxymethyl)furan-2-yl)methanamine synthase
MSHCAAIAWIGLDVGGANVKIAHSSGQTRSMPFELWKHPQDLSRFLSALIDMLPPFDHVAVTMTAELCDCYPTKSDGVHDVLTAVENAARSRPIWVWGTDEAFHSVASALERPEIAAASNWLALATLAARLIPEGPGLLIDVGSTTTDLIPMRDGRPVPRGRTDTQRLQSGELVYAGVRRTPVCAIASELAWRGTTTGLAAELFATTLDVYLIRGDIPPDASDSTTADGRPSTVDGARERLARMVGADRNGFSSDDAVAFAHAADAALISRLESAAERVVVATIGQPRAAVVAGSGEFLARRLASRVVGPDGAIVGLSEAWGPVASSAGCAYALVVLASELEV